MCLELVLQKGQIAILASLESLLECSPFVKTFNRMLCNICVRKVEKAMAAMLGRFQCRLIGSSERASPGKRSVRRARKCRCYPNQTDVMLGGVSFPSIRRSPVVGSYWRSIRVAVWMRSSECRFRQGRTLVLHTGVFPAGFISHQCPGIEGKGFGDSLRLPGSGFRGPTA
jgi:hypothetical protein